MRPHVISQKNNGRADSFLIGRLEIKPLVVPLGYKKVPVFAVHCLTLSYDGLSGDTSDESVSKLVDSVLSSLREGDADLACFSIWTMIPIFFESYVRLAGYCSGTIFFQRGTIAGQSDSPEAMRGL